MYTGSSIAIIHHTRTQIDVQPDMKAVEWWSRIQVAAAWMVLVSNFVAIFLNTLNEQQFVIDFVSMVFVAFSIVSIHYYVEKNAEKNGEMLDLSV